MRHVMMVAAKVKVGLERADWNSRREIVRTLVKRVEVDERQVNLVFRVNEYPFDSRPDGGILLHCGRRNQPHLGQRVLALRPRRMDGDGGEAADAGRDVSHPLRG